MTSYGNLPAKCPECESTDFIWGVSANRGFLGCSECSETLRVMSPDSAIQILAEEVERLKGEMAGLATRAEVGARYIWAVADERQHAAPQIIGSEPNQGVSGGDGS